LELFESKIQLDDRGAFIRIYDCMNFKLDSDGVKQINVSVNPISGTLRGMHFQTKGEPEHKLLAVVQGTVYLTIVDLRIDSPTYLKIFTAVVENQFKNSYFIPAGCATGWLTLMPNTILHYTMWARYEESEYSGFRYDDPFFNLKWPSRPTMISKKDLNWARFSSAI
jgi:dTDP-4-dehydrorhamnose 3,5-epimerase